MENGNLSMRENLVMTSAYAHPYIRTGSGVLSRLCRGGGGESKTVHLEAANGVFQAKIFSFVCLTCDKKL